MLGKKLYLIEHTVVNGDNVTYTIRQNKSNDIFQAHFPGNPITPGACLIEIAKELCEHFLDRSLSVKTIKNVKFISLITPIENEFLNFHIATSVDENSVQAKVQISSDGNICSKINFELV